MLVKGKKLGANVDYFVIPRADGKIVFQLGPIKDWSVFEKIYPLPEPRSVMRAGGQMGKDYNDPNYKTALETYGKLKSSWTVLNTIHSIKYYYNDGSVEEISWEKVKLSDPNTWNGYIDELRESNFSDGEIGNLLQKTSEMNGLNEAKLDEARKDFLAILQAGQKE